jgi:hypothetical protein
MFLTLVVLALVKAAIGPTFYTFALLPVLRPFAHITRSICIIITSRLSMSFVPLPIPFIAITISKCKSAIFGSLSFMPESDIEGPIRPYLNSKTFS